MCSFNDKATLEGHSYTTLALLEHTSEGTTVPPNPFRESFLKTLGLFCSIKEQGCSYPVVQKASPGPDASDEASDDTGSDASAQEDHLPDIQSKAKGKTCSGKILFKRDKHGKPYIRCEHRYSDDHQSHLLMRSLHEYEPEYLDALFNDNKSIIEKFEKRAKEEGYGPLAPCYYITSSQAQKVQCSDWHRDENGILKRGEPTKTPPIYIDIFSSLLRQLQWKLADATLRRLTMDSGFTNALKHVLGWENSREPLLADLHPSFANLDHVNYMIECVQQYMYPEGTGWNALLNLYEKEKVLPNQERYIQWIEEFTVPGEDGKCRIIILMFSEQSTLLLSSKWPTMDTAFKRVHEWQEFEMEEWNVKSKSCKITST
ncbi:hypothetical protein FRC02_003993 [Tulasnella sp. 418]|nr:hypothetical protein FRC02_003993 [Tulasnella sp. 418]